MVFCDFDGTITVEETFVAMLKRFAPEAAAQVLPEIYSKRVTLRQGVRQMVEAIPSSSYLDIIEFTRSKAIRPGFVELLDFLEQEAIPFIVISGGFRGMVEAVLKPYRDRIGAIHAMDIDTTDAFLQLNSAYESGTEIVAKAEIMATYGADETIAIGDSVTDWNLAMAASLVFARPPLTQYLEEQKKPYLAWEDFFDVQAQLARYLK
jgi:2-hydroxy-3-keto-5-methylthiopentenyl-1-phosphate phosphatase